MSIISNIIDSDLRGFKVNDEIVVDKNVIGEFIKNSAKLTILNKNHQYDSLEKTYLNITNFGKWYVDNLNNNEESVEADLTLFDLSIKFDEDYDDSFTFPATLREWANWIGNKVGVPLKGPFLNSDKQLTEKPYLGSNPKYRTAVKIIAKYASGWAEINEDETYSIRWFDNTTINIEDWENFKHGSTTDPVNIIILSTGVTEDNIRYPEQIPNNAHELRIEDDWLAIDRYLISKSIFEQVNGFSYTAITELTLPYGLLEFKVGQKIKTKDIELNDVETYISSHTLTWDGGDWNDPNSWTSSLKMNELKETTTKYQYSNSIENRVGKTEINCDKNNKKINMLVEDVNEVGKDITQLKLENSRISQQVSHVATISIESTGTGIQKLIGLNTNKLIYLEIHPTNHDIDTQYLSNYILLSEGILLDQPVLSIIGKNIFNARLPNLYHINDVYDTFIQDNVKEETYIIHRIGFDSNGNRYVLENELIEKIEMNPIILEEGDYQFFISGILDAYISVRGVLKNDYTSLFATKVEMNSSIEETANSINLSVDEKLGNVEEEIHGELELKVGVNDNDKVVSMINAAADDITLAGGSRINITTAGKLLINAGNFKLDENGKATTRNADFIGGSINLSNDGIESPAFKILGKGEYISNSESAFFSDGVRIYDSLKRKLVSLHVIKNLDDSCYEGRLFLKSDDGNKEMSINTDYINFYNRSNNNQISLGLYSSEPNSKIYISPSKILINELSVITSSYHNTNRVASLGMVYGDNSYLEVITGNGAYGVNVWASDKRFKRRIEDSKYNALDTLRKIKHRQFIYRKTNEKVLIGYVADELKEVDPNMIFEVGPNKIKQPSQSYLIPIISKSVLELDEEVRKQQEEIGALKNQIKELMNLVKKGN